MDETASPIDRFRRPLSYEPAVTIPTLISWALYFIDKNIYPLTAEDIDIIWLALGPAIGLVIRQFVYAPATVKKLIRGNGQ